MRAFVRQNSLSLFFGAIFVMALVGQAFAGQHAYNAQQAEHGGSTVSWPTYVTSVVYWGDVMENWQSEFLQRRLTRESRAVSSPAWSPDGRVS